MAIILVSGVIQIIMYNKLISVFTVENILNNTNLTVVVYNGNLDVVTPIAGNYFVLYVTITADQINR